ncbi:DNA polymerase Y family protein [Sandarakinorhabdus sp.]|uniref:Y-family DNA polymerase n=1 Tax=Sandarakinorhabdus sp. TaxID=1916663 RepID=UPI00286DF7F9|nr:DNA polymerase Y family protein [Sandarakinorhabdus sp.]
MTENASALRATRAVRRILALHLPLLPSERRAAQSGARRDAAPLALIVQDRGRQVIAALDAAALAEGLAPGLSLADARARVPTLQALPHDPAGDAAWLDWLALAATRYTPMAAAAPPDGLLLDISGCAHLFGGEASLVADIVTRLSRIGLTAQPAIAATPAAALALARHGGHRLGDLPVAALTNDESVRTALRRAGLLRIGDLVRQPRGALASRFGAGLLAALDQLTEAQDQPLSPLLIAAPIAAEQRLASPVADEGAVLAVAEKLLLRCAMQLAARGEGGRAFAVTLYRADGHVAQVMVETSAPVRDAAPVMRLLRERLAALADPLDPGFGYDLVRLDVPVTAALAHQQLGLDGGDIAEGELAALLDRLTARLGPGRVRRLVRHDSHIPEQAAFDLPLSAGAPQLDWPAPPPGEPPTRPLRLFDPPQPIEVLAEVPDGPPRRFRWRRRLHEITRHEGPERIASQWWRRRSGDGLTRDYYRVEDAAGQRYWVFRHGLYGTEKASPAWFIHGLFA